MSDIYPFLAVQEVDAAVEFYSRAFGAIEVGERVRAADGPQVALLRILDHRLGVATEVPDLGTPSPETLGAPAVRISLDVADPDLVVARAVAHRAHLMFPSPTRPAGCGRDAWSTPSATTG